MRFQIGPARGSTLGTDNIASQLLPKSSMKTNICSVPAGKASELKERDRRSEVFSFLLHEIQPNLVFVHGNQPIEFFVRVEAPVHPRRPELLTPSAGSYFQRVQR
ncbi:hypothetical protein ACUN0C_14360 [Faunimonas sp. B44]|uniref:hypothetical protein n=1 Tax=Faunimonas sp. B44 TaxID=3461493 RepID=UPI0040446298